MIINISDEKIVIPFINTLINDKCFSSPMLHTEEELKQNLIRRIKHPDDLVLAIYDNNNIIGVFSVLIEKKENYMEVLLIFSKERKAYDEFFEYLKNNYNGWKCDVVTNPKNYIIFNKLKELNGNFDIEQNYMRLENFKEYIHNLTIVKYEEKYKDEYISIHTKDRYWTAEKVLNALDRFNVFLAIDKKVVGYIDVTSKFETNEPLDLFVLKDYRNKGYGKALLCEAIKANFPNNMDLSVDINNESGKHIYEELGFVYNHIKDSITIHLVIA